MSNSDKSNSNAGMIYMAKTMPMCLSMSSELASIWRDKPPKPLWLAWQAPAHIPDDIDVDAKLIWQAYVHRWPVESGIRFRKQRLGWTTSHFQHKEHPLNYTCKEDVVGKLCEP
jgi:hypothetical protein